MSLVSRLVKKDRTLKGYESEGCILITTFKAYRDCEKKKKKEREETYRNGGQNLVVVGLVAVDEPFQDPGQYQQGKDMRMRRSHSGLISATWVNLILYTFGPFPLVEDDASARVTSNSCEPVSKGSLRMLKMFLRPSYTQRGVKLVGFVRLRT